VNLAIAQKNIQTGSPTRETITDTELIAQTMPELIWIVPGLIPEGVMVLGGRPKTGKSQLALDIGLTVARGGKAFGTIQVEQRQVLYFPMEDTHRRLQMFVIKKQGSASTGHIHFARSGPKPGESVTKFLEKHIANITDLKLIVLDTLGKFCGCRGISSYKESYSQLAELKAVADKHHLALIVVHHTTKGKVKDAFDSVMGSTGITAACDTVAVLSRERGQNEGSLTISGREVQENVFAMQFESETLSWKLIGPAEAPMSEERREVLELLRGADKEMKLKDIGKALCKKGPVLFKHLEGLIECGLVEKPRHGFYQAVPRDSGEITNSGERGENAVEGEDDDYGEDSNLGESADSSDFIEAGEIEDSGRHEAGTDIHDSLTKEASEADFISRSADMMKFECAEGFFEWMN